MIYMDANATEAPRPQAAAAMLAALALPGNPSSIHAAGRAARKLLEDAREGIATRFGARPADLVFTSGGTEADALAVHALGQGRRIIIGATEHDAIRAAAPDALRLPVDANGVADLDALAALLAAGPALVCLMLANNETGVLHPIAAAAALCRAHGALLHVDAIQAAGRLAVDLPSLGATSLALSAHKIGGPQGMGALIVRDHVPFKPLLSGGGQERNRRAGTENVAGIIGFGTAATLAADDLRDMPRITALRRQLETKLIESHGDDIVIVGATTPRVANTTCVALRGVSAETQVAAMDLAGIAISAGSACSSGKVKSSHVLRAMGYGPDIAGCAIRISLGWHSQDKDIQRCLDAWENFAQRARGNKNLAA